MSTSAVTLRRTVFAAAVALAVSNALALPAADASVNSLNLPGSEFFVGQTYEVWSDVTELYEPATLKDNNAQVGGVEFPAASQTVIFKWTPATTGVHQLLVCQTSGWCYGASPEVKQATGTRTGTGSFGF